MKLSDKKSVKRCTKRISTVILFVLLFSLCFSIACFADTTAANQTSDPLTVIANLSDFIFAILRAVGVIMMAFGLVQLGLSFKSHDPSQRSNAILTLVGGLIITFSKEIINIIMP